MTVSVASWGVGVGGQGGGGGGGSDTSACTAAAVVAEKGPLDNDCLCCSGGGGGGRGLDSLVKLALQQLWWLKRAHQTVTVSVAAMGVGGRGEGVGGGQGIMAIRPFPHDNTAAERQRLRLHWPKLTKEWTKGWRQLTQRLRFLLSSGLVVEQR